MSKKGKKLPLKVAGKGSAKGKPNPFETVSAKRKFPVLGQKVKGSVKKNVVQVCINT
jgi:hypothetical protein